MTTASYESLSHAKWDGQYHVVFIPRSYRRLLLDSRVVDGFRRKFEHVDDLG
jgi:REP element-mobilizing transposase RayT